MWVGQGNTPADGITKNLWQAVLPAAQSPWGMANSWGMPLAVRDDSIAGTPKPIKNLPLGHALPDLRWSVGNNFSYKKFTAYVLFDAVKGKDVLLFNVSTVEDSLRRNLCAAEFVHVMPSQA